MYLVFGTVQEDWASKITAPSASSNCAVPCAGRSSTTTVSYFMNGGQVGFKCCSTRLWTDRDAVEAGCKEMNIELMILLAECDHGRRKLSHTALS